MMRIGIDARGLQHVSDTSRPQYLNHLIKALQDADRNNEYVLLFNYIRGRWDTIVSSYVFNDNVKKHVLRFPQKFTPFLLQRLHFPVDTFLGKLDIMHNPWYSRTNISRGKTVVTIHDLVFIRDKQAVPAWWSREGEKMVVDTVKNADAIVTISEFTKTEIMNLFNAPEEKIHVIYNGIGGEFSPEAGGILEVKKKYRIERDYFLYVGAIEPRKNLSRLAQAYSQLPQTIKESFQLVIAGIPRYKSDEVFAKVQKLQLENNILFTGRIASKDLPVLYAGAELFVFPSLFEGFGIPPLEAMASGTPVIASNVTSVPEVVGNSAYLINPMSTEEIADGIQTVLMDSSLQQELRQKGLDRAHFFSWQNTAQQTLELYTRLVKG